MKDKYQCIVVLNITNGLGNIVNTYYTKYYAK